MVKPAPEPNVESVGSPVDLKGRHYYKTSVYLDRENTERFQEIFPAQGALKEFLNACLSKFLEIHEPARADEELSETVGHVISEMREEEEK